MSRFYTRRHPRDEEGHASGTVDVVDIRNFHAAITCSERVADFVCGTLNAVHSPYGSGAARFIVVQSYGKHAILDEDGKEVCQVRADESQFVCDALNSAEARKRISA